MVVPVVGARVEKGHSLATFRRRYFNATGFVQIAARTGPGEIVQLG
jgi:hypothetical protein